jgi:hypothetical protein
LTAPDDFAMRHVVARTVFSVLHGGDAHSARRLTRNDRVVPVRARRTGSEQVND